MERDGQVFSEKQLKVQGIKETNWSSLLGGAFNALRSFVACHQDPGELSVGPDENLEDVTCGSN
jgi:hypothetical protein